jgi:hypothetical protein
VAIVAWVCVGLRGSGKRTNGAYKRVREWRNGMETQHAAQACTHIHGGCDGRGSPGGKHGGCGRPRDNDGQQKVLQGPIVQLVKVGARHTRVGQALIQGHHVPGDRVPHGLGDRRDRGGEIGKRLQGQGGGEEGGERAAVIAEGEERGRACGD